jgi:opacity protein-like surface antigen
MRKVVAFLFVAALLAAVPAQAQDKRIDVHVGFGYTFTLSEVRKYLGDGYNFSIGMALNLTPILGVQGEYSYNGLGKKQVRIPVSGVPGGAATDLPFYGDMNLQYGDANLVIKAPTTGRLRPYGIAGVGVYYRPVKVTTPALGYVPGYCSPWWYWCYPGGFVEVDKIIGTRSSTDFGLDFGGGLNIMVTDTASVYIEARYHYIWGPEIRDQEGTSHGKANGQFLPIIFGIRF